MAENFIGEIRPFPYDFPPRSWAFCEGQLLPINQNQALFSLLGTTFGGNGQTNFALPDLRGRIALGAGQGPGLPQVSLGTVGGEEASTLHPNAVPAHTHEVRCASAATSNSPAGNVPATHGGHKIYGDPTSESLPADTIGNTGGGQPHPNMQPYLTVSYCIALVGIFPPRN